MSTSMEETYSPGDGGPFADTLLDAHDKLAIGYINTQLTGEIWLQLLYVGSAFLFILALRGLGNQETARMGNVYGILGMAVGLGATIASDFVFGRGYWIIAVAAVPAAILASVASAKVVMTGMPQMVGMLNAFGGLAATLEGVALFVDDWEEVRQGRLGKGSEEIIYQDIFYLSGIVVGTVTFTGSVLAVLKLQGTIRGTFIVPLRSIVVPAIYGGIIALGVLASHNGLGSNAGLGLMLAMLGLSGAYGVIFVAAIGGADMPVVISILNSLSGWAGVFAGFMTQNDLLIITGAFVGASGMILSVIMCAAMNRSLYNVLVGGFGEGSGAPAAGPAMQFDGQVTKIDGKGVTELLLAAKSVIVVPGYGMAASRAQHAVAEMVTELRSRGINTRFGVHPVAGRLPGHMNVLLAEASVPYDIVSSMDEINGDFPETDVVVVIGANDTVNPAAELDPSSAIYGMPVLQVWQAKTTVVMKRSLASGYANVENPLFLYPNNRMLLGDAKKMLEEVLEGLRAAPRLADVKAHGKAKKAVKEKKEKKERHPTSKKVGVLRERAKDEKRVALTPDIVERLFELGFSSVVESGAGVGAGFTDAAYVEAGATVVATPEEVCAEVEVILKVNAPTEYEGRPHEIDLFRPSQVVVSFVGPAQNKDLLERAAARGVTLMAMDAVPRISRAQKLDVLSSMGKIAGYRAVVEAASHFQRFFTPEITAAGKYPPAKVLVIGAGVAGLQAIGTAHAMGADVRAFDTRLETRDQVESMGGEFLVMEFEEDGAGEGGYAKVMSEEFIAKEMELFQEQAEEVDIIITTAAIPGRRAPILIKKEHVDSMKAGSVIVDLAAATGGNVEVTRPGETYLYNDKVTIVGATDLPSRMASQASAMYGTNLWFLLDEMGGAKTFNVDFENEVIRGMTVAHKGEVTYPPPKSAGPPPQIRSMPAIPPVATPHKHTKPSLLDHRFFNLVSIKEVIFPLLFMGLIVVLAIFSPRSFGGQFMVFMLGSWVGYLLVCNVIPALHTPLMSASNAISGVVILGGLLGVSPGKTQDLYDWPNQYAVEGWYDWKFWQVRSTDAVVLNAIAIAVASMNIAGGFVVTQRMLSMFRKS
eukprot:jgi/Mesvir1/4490/Mv09574-RA.1